MFTHFSLRFKAWLWQVAFGPLEGPSDASPSPPSQRPSSTEMPDFRRKMKKKEMKKKEIIEVMKSYKEVNVNKFLFKKKKNVYNIYYIIYIYKLL